MHTSESSALRAREDTAIVNAVHTLIADPLLLDALRQDPARVLRRLALSGIAAQAVLSAFAMSVASEVSIGITWW
jgi:hypothetical protein